jgi:hypothetical protein
MRLRRIAVLLLAAAPAGAQPAAPAPAPASPKPTTPPVARPASPAAAAAAPATVTPAPATAKPADPQRGITPNAEREVRIGAINKRTGESKTFVGHPGQYFDFHGLRVTVRTCETTPPWEQKLTGAFLLIDERLAKGGAKRVYSGWMFAESPSLHPLEHARYDVWVKSCAMRFPDSGPDTVSAGRGDASGSGSKKSSRSAAKKSADTVSAEVN